MVTICIVPQFLGYTFHRLGYFRLFIFLPRVVVCACVVKYVRSLNRLKRQTFHELNLSHLRQSAHGNFSPFDKFIM